MRSKLSYSMFIAMALSTPAAVPWTWASGLTPAATRAAPVAASTTGIPAHKLGKVEVKGTAAIKAEVRALQTIKVALKKPFSDDPAKAGATVCRIIHRSRGVHVAERMGAILECGSNSWFTWRRSNCQNEGIAACAAQLPTSTYKRKGAWHKERAISLTQVMQLRKLVATLPPPDSTRTIIVTGYHAPATRAPSATSHR